MMARWKRRGKACGAAQIPCSTARFKGKKAQTVLAQGSLCLPMWPGLILTPRNGKTELLLEIKAGWGSAGDKGLEAGRHSSLGFES